MDRKLWEEVRADTGIDCHGYRVPLPDSGGSPHAGAQTHRNSGICGYYLDDGRRFLSGQCVCHCNVYGICARHGA